MFERKIEDYKNAIQTEKRERVIVVRFLYNKPYDEALEERTNSSEAITVTGKMKPVATLWRSTMRSCGGSEPACSMFRSMTMAASSGRRTTATDSRSGIKAYHVLDWTEEREQFLFQMVNSLEGLIRRLNGFFGDDLVQNMTKAIASGGGLNALPAPAQDSR
jgi:hypothetical protein